MKNLSVTPFVRWRCIISRRDEKREKEKEKRTFGQKREGKKQETTWKGENRLGRKSYLQRLKSGEGLEKPTAMEEGGEEEKRPLLRRVCLENKES